MAILIENRQKRIKTDLRRLRTVARKILNYLELSESELSIVLLDNEQIREVNKNYLGKDKPTNVVSFSMSDGEFGNVNPTILGDVIISVEKAHDDAARNGRSPDDEIDHLLIHGILHLIGYNHEKTTRVECRRMSKKSNDLFFLLKGYYITGQSI